MIKHIVLFKLKEQVNVRLKEENLIELKETLLGLKNKIDKIMGLEVGIKINEAPETHYDLFLSTTFKNLDDLNIYRNHPEHLKVVNLIKRIVEKTSAIDFKL